MKLMKEEKKKKAKEEEEGERRWMGMARPPFAFFLLPFAGASVA